MKLGRWSVLLTLTWFVGGLVALIHSEHPRGRVVGKVIASETGQTLSKAEIWFDHPKGTWKAMSNEEGYFELSNLPTGIYTVTASTYAHRLKATKFALREGETRNLLIALDPIEPFLEIIHPQTVFHPEEIVKVGVRGFIPSDELEIQVWQVQMGRALKSVPLTSVLSFLEEVRWGWWRGVWELRDALKNFSACLTKVSEMAVPITQRDGEGVFLQFVPIPLPSEGIYLVRISAESLERVAVIELTKIGLVAKVGSDREGRAIALVYAANLKTGEPVKGVKISVWLRERLVGRERDRLIASSATDANGMVRFLLTEMNGDVGDCFLVASQPNSQKLWPIAWVALNECALEDSFASREPIVGKIYTDRPVYRPGNTVHFKGIARKQSPKGYRLLKSTVFSVLVRDPHGNIVHRADTPINGFGSFYGSFTLSDEAPVGVYTIEAEVLRDEGEGGKIEGSFSVAAYRKPEVYINVKPARRRFSRSETVTVTITSRYYFGMPVSGAEVSYWIARLPVLDESEGFEWGEGRGGEIVLEGRTKTDSNGQAVISFRLKDSPPETPPFSENRYEVHVVVEAEGYFPVEGSTSFIVTQGDWKLTISAEPSFGCEEEAIIAKVKVTHWDTRKPQASAVIRWRSGMVEWLGRETKIRWKFNGECKTDKNGEAKWQFVPEESGDWVIEAVVRDQRRNSIGAETYLWVMPRRYTSPFSPKSPPLQLWLDKTSYRVGEEAKIAVRSKLENATVLVTVEGGRLHSFKLLNLRNGMAQWRFKLAEDLMPNAYVTASLVWQKKFVQETKGLRFDLDGYRLQVTVESDRGVYEPRQPAKLTMRVSDKVGNPVRAELSVAVVDEAIYAIKEDDPEQVFRAFYAERPNRVLTFYSFPWLAWQGDKGEVETIRRYFPATALWLPHVVTDEKGTAQVQLKVPDTLTQWRVTVIAQSPDTKVGYAVAKFRSTTPFSVRIAAPTVLTQGDLTTISAIIHNDTDRVCVASVEAQVKHEGREIERRRREVEGAGATPSPASPHQTPLVLSLPPQTLTLEPRKTKAVKWDFVAERSGQFVITVRAKSDDGRRDAEQRVITVSPHATERMVSRTILIGPDETVRELKILLPPNVDLWASRISVRLAPSIFSMFFGTLEYLANYPYGCVEQTMNSLLPDILVWRILKERDIDAHRLEREVSFMVRRGLRKLYRFQHADGGWGWWEDDQTDLWMTALVVRGLAEAKRAGFEVSEIALTKGIEALERVLESEEYRRDSDEVAFALFALARAGAKVPLLHRILSPTPVVTSDAQQISLAKIINHCSPYGLAFLTLALHEWRRPEARQLAQKLLETSMPLRGELCWSVSGSSSMSRWTTDEETTAWALLALMRTKSVDIGLAAEVIKSLLQKRKGDGWISTKDTAAVLEAILEFARRFERATVKAPLTVTLSFNGSSRNLRLPPEAQLQPEATVRLIGDLKAGANELKISKPKGPALWVTVIVKQVLALAEGTGELLASEKRIQRCYEKLFVRVSGGGHFEWRVKPLRSGDAVKVGDLIRVTLTVDCPIDFTVLEDPLPAGMRVLEGRVFRISDDGYGDVGIPPKEVRDDRTVTYFRNSGRYVVRYLLRAEVPGDYHILPPQLWHMYGMERWNGAEDRLRVLP